MKTFLSMTPLLTALIASTGCAHQAPAPDLAVSALTAPHSFTPGIEGPAVDSKGTLYAVNYARQQTIGAIGPDGAAEVYATLPGKSIGNGIRFGKDGTMYVADFVGHNVLRIDPATRAVTVFAHDPAMHQPNDLAITAAGVLYASDPDWKNNGGKVWRIDQAGRATLVADGMGTANGIEVSPDGRTLYVGESMQRVIWAFAIGADGALSGKREFARFPDFGLDGMRADIDGNLYVTRYGKGTVIKMSPDGKLLREIALPGKKPSNLAFGGPDGRTVYVTEVENGQLLQFRADRPGNEWRQLR